MTVRARGLLRRPVVSGLVGADILCSLSYGVLSVVLVSVSTRLGWHESGYGVLRRPARVRAALPREATHDP